MKLLFLFAIVFLTACVPQKDNSLEIPELLTGAGPLNLSKFSNEKVSVINYTVVDDRVEVWINGTWTTNTERDYDCLTTIGFIRQTIEYRVFLHHACDRGTDFFSRANRARVLS